jgi:hypothetical protein
MEAVNRTDNGTNLDFSCVDPNPYWLGDYTCGCAFNYSAGAGYADSIASSCGTGSVANVTNYELSLYMQAHPTTRSHICRLLENPSPDCGANSTGM